MKQESRKQPSGIRERGSMLIVALAVLALLSIIAVTFAALMRLERKATTNFSNTVRSDMVAASAESTLISMFRGGYYWDGYTDSRPEQSPWIYRDATGESALGGILNLEEAEPRATSVQASLGTLGRSSEKGFFKTKVIDAAAQININGAQDNLAEMIDNLGLALKDDPRYGTNPLWSEPDEGGRQVTGSQIVRFRNTLEGNKFQSKVELRNIIGSANYELIADFLTTKSWVDGSTFRSADAIPRYNVTEEQAQTAVANNSERTTSADVGPPSLIEEPRAPININTASEPVLVACLTGLAGRRAFPLVEIDPDEIMGKNRSEIDLEEGSLPPGKEELFLKHTPVWVYTQALSREVARRIAKEIISQRKSTPFKTWSSGTGGKNSGGFEEFINQLPDSLFPNQTTITVVNPRDVRGSNRYKNALIRGGGQNADSNRLYVRGHPTGESSIRRSRGLAYSGQYAWYYDTMRAVLKANFNPNTRLNAFNPNETSYAPVDKFNLVRLAAEGSSNPALGDLVAGHTTEFCFDSNGVYEITTVADVALSKAESGPEALLPGERIARTKRRSVVKVFDVLRHTTQADFERPFRTGPFSSAGDRQYVTSYPDPQDALHDELYYGSELDGRVELSGYLDGLRGEAASSQRSEFFQGRQGIVMHHGFRYRNDRSRSDLLKLERRGGNRGGQEIVNELARIFDPEYSRSGSQFEKRYSAANWGAQDSAEEAANIKDPIVSTAGRNSDLFPDGINTSINRKSARGTGFLRFPASVYRKGPADPGELRRSYSNDSGNLPYYNGGAAFWVKLENDGDDPVFNGFFGATQVQTRTGPNLIDSEGTQFYVWRNTAGQLRVSRLYYHQAFQQGSTALAIPQFPEEGEEGDLDEDEQYVDPKKAWARTDVVIDISNWRAREWHHISIGYNDELTGNRVSVFVDFKDVDAVSHNLGEEQFVTLNVEEPKDGMFVAGFYRDQAVDDEGLFKFGTNWNQRDGGLQRGDIKRVHANATIDEFMTFTGNYVAPFGPIGYFTDKQGKYTNRFEVPFPDGIQRVRLRSIGWTVLQPRLYNRQPVRFSDQNINFSVANVGAGGFTLQPIRDAGGDAVLNPQFAGKWLYSRSTALAGRTGDLVYQLTMRGGLGSGEFGARVVASPALEDVTLTYYLPSAQTLLTEVEN